MPRDYAALAVGDTISDRTFPVGLDGVEKYTAAVRDESGVFNPTSESPTVPPMAVATFALRGVLDDLGIPEGTLHVGQEMAFLGAVRADEELSCQGGDLAERGEDGLSASWPSGWMSVTVATGR